MGRTLPGRRCLFYFSLLKRPVCDSVPPFGGKMRFFKVVFALLFISTLLFGAERGWNCPELAEAYHHHSEIQREWAMELIGSFPFEGAEEILDFGCGDGKISAWLSHRVPNGSVTGYDISSSMIELAKQLFLPSSYENLHFQTSEITGVYDLICSFSVLHFVDDPLATLIDLKSHLKPTGLLLLTIPEAPSLKKRKIANDLLQKLEIEQPWKNRPSYTHEFSIRTLKGCEIHLKEAGFEILSIRKEDSPYLFQDVEAYINWNIGTASANWGIPFSSCRSVFTEFVQKLLESDPELLDSNGRLIELIPRIHVVAKPMSTEALSRMRLAKRVELQSNEQNDYRIYY